jgi:helicase
LPFKGLFIGIDRYASPGINWLNCARRDARALHGLFIDSMGGETALLTDEQATSAAIAEEFRKLSSAAPDDVVVIAFSGHGSETHEIARSRRQGMRAHHSPIVANGMSIPAIR